VDRRCIFLSTLGTVSLSLAINLSFGKRSDVKTRRFRSASNGRSAIRAMSIVGARSSTQKSAAQNNGTASGVDIFAPAAGPRSDRLFSDGAGRSTCRRKIFAPEQLRHVARDWPDHSSRTTYFVRSDSFQSAVGTNGTYTSLLHVPQIRQTWEQPTGTVPLPRMSAVVPAATNTSRNYECRNKVYSNAGKGPFKYPNDNQQIEVSIFGGSNLRARTCAKRKCWTQTASVDKTLPKLQFCAYLELAA